MKRSRKPAKPRLTQDGEKLITLALGLAGSGGRAEDRYWENALTATLTALADGRRDSVIDNVLDQLYQTHDAGYESLIDIAEGVAETVLLEHDAVTWEVMLISIPLMAVSKYGIPFGPIAQEHLPALKEFVGGQILAANARLAIAPYLFSIEHLPQKFSALRDMARRLGLAAVSGEAPNWSPKAHTEPPQLPADARFLMAAIAAPAGEAHFCWQEWEGHRGRSHCLERWAASVPLAFAQLMQGCQFEALLPDAYFANAREADRRIRPITIHAAVAFLVGALKVTAPELCTVIAGFGDSQVDEYRVAFTEKTSNEVVHGVVWPLYEQEEEHLVVEEIDACLRASGVTQIDKLAERFAPEFCSDCGAPLFADSTGDVVHPELPEQAEIQPQVLH